MVFLFNFFVLYFLNFPSQITFIAFVEFWFGLLCSFFFFFLKKKNKRNFSFIKTKYTWLQIWMYLPMDFH